MTLVIGNQLLRHYYLQRKFKMIIAKYIHGSEDSTDIDVHYVFDKMPTFQECKEFCDSDKSENRNIITIENGIVTSCYKGTIDEINNALIETYPLHKQEYPLLVECKVERDKVLKYIRAVRIILSYLSHTIYRKQIKSALKGTWEERIKTLEEIDLTKIDFDSLAKHNNKLDVLKIIAFQIGQCWGLIGDVEYYTKYSIAQDYPFLKRYLYRKETEVDGLNVDLHMFAEDLKYAVKPEDILKYDLKNEKRNE